MRIMEIAKRYKMRPLALYNLMYELEAKGIIDVERRGRHLRLRPFEIAEIEKEIERRGYHSVLKGKGD